MPRVRRKSRLRFRTATEARTFAILESLRAQYRRRPNGPFRVPDGIAGLLAQKQFTRELREKSEGRHE
jgi:hypothetical protein